MATGGEIQNGLGQSTWQAVKANPIQAAQGIIQTAKGIFGPGLRKQVDQQTKLNRRTASMNYEFNKMQAEDDVKRQEEWFNKYASPAAVRQQLQEAGLNPNLMYESGGGAGAQGRMIPQEGGSIGTNGGNVAAMAAATSQGGALAIQAAKMISEIKLNESVANKNNTEADFTAGVKTEETKSNIEVNAATIKQKLADEHLSTVQSENIVKQLEEAVRHNHQTEGVDWAKVQFSYENLNEIARHNRTLEGLSKTQLAEITRHNTASEAINYYQAITGRQVGDQNIALSEQQERKIKYELLKDKATGTVRTISYTEAQQMGLGPIKATDSSQQTRDYVIFVGEDGTVTVRQTEEDFKEMTNDKIEEQAQNQ